MDAIKQQPPALPPAGPEKKVPFTPLLSILIIVVLLVAIVLVTTLGISAFGVFGPGQNHGQPGQVFQPRQERQAIEADYLGNWQGFGPDGKTEVIMFSPDNRFRHWISDKSAMRSYNGTWRYDSSLFLYRLRYDKEDYSASVKISPIVDGEPTVMHFEPLSSAEGMPLKGFELEKLNSS